LQATANPLHLGFEDRVDATMPEKLLWTTLDRKHWSYDWAKVGKEEGRVVSGGLGWNFSNPRAVF